MTANEAVNQTMRPPRTSKRIPSQRFAPMFTSVNLMLLSIDLPFISAIRSYALYVRFNTMQAIVLDVLLIFPDLLERSFNPRDGFGLDVVMSLDSTVFLFLLVSLIYGFYACLFGLIPRLPIYADAADRQVL
ncbi:unnamed protein product [Eruca vesicaria subsp. sativa]|uniref:Protein TIC 20 n=1 Tax=Eruca vesicaria subsp. sativa TaxID=29727 RepID=A0ABC8KPJ9_ERUVS|nr:unnamed protein product [Eruca vesicaria subsp. sativa]